MTKRGIIQSQTPRGQIGRILIFISLLKFSMRFLENPISFRFQLSKNRPEPQLHNSDFDGDLNLYFSHTWLMMNFTGQKLTFFFRMARIIKQQVNYRRF